MKITKIPGLGRFGVFVDDIDFNTITNEEWIELGKLHLQSLVTIIRNTNLNLSNYDKFIYKWGSARALSKAHLMKKYPQGWDWMWQCVNNNDDAMHIDDRRWLTTVDGLGQRTEIGRVQRVSGRKDENGNPMGMFAEGDLLWHSNESGQIHHTPAVSLLAAENVIGSSTGFITTPDYYESVSNAFRSELDEMIVIHRFSPGKINPGLPAEQDFLMHSNMCPDEESEIPLVIQSPAGIRGLHYSVNTVSQIKGMSIEDSRRIFDIIDQELFVDKYIYDHWYQSNNDLCLFDNTITLHRRQGDIKNRLCYRIQYDYTNLQTAPYMPYFQNEFQQIYRERITEAITALNIKDFKLP